MCNPTCVESKVKFLLKKMIRVTPEEWAQKFWKLCPSISLPLSLSPSLSSETFNPFLVRCLLLRCPSFFLRLLFRCVYLRRGLKARHYHRFHCGMRELHLHLCDKTDFEIFPASCARLLLRRRCARHVVPRRLSLRSVQTSLNCGRYLCTIE